MAGSEEAITINLYGKAFERSQILPRPPPPSPPPPITSRKPFSYLRHTLPTDAQNKWRGSSCAHRYSSKLRRLADEMLSVILGEGAWAGVGGGGGGRSGLGVSPPCIRAAAKQMLKTVFGFAFFPFFFQLGKTGTKDVCIW